MENSFDVIVIGAGAAGLMAAWELAQTGKTTAVIEAKERIGGRILTIEDDQFELPVEAGAEFVHGDLELTQLLVKKADARLYEVSGDIWQNDDGKIEEQSDFIENYSALEKKLKELNGDIPVAEFIDKYLQEEKFEELRFSLKNYVEGYYAADTTKASTLSMKEELTESSDKQYRIEGGYGKLVNYLHEACKQKAVQFFLSQPVKEVRWKKDEVQIITNQKQFFASKVLITVSVGVLQSEKIHFSPGIPEKITAAKQLGYGVVIKTVLQLEEPFWKNKELTQGKDLSKLSFIFSEAVIPTWWTYYPKDAAMITGWSGGPNADAIKHLSEKEILQKALQSLSKIFTISVADLEKKVKAWHVTNWSDDLHHCGAYSYDVVNGDEYKRILKQPVESTIYFAGEGLHEGVEIGTVEAALISARDTAHQLVAAFKK